MNECTFDIYNVRFCNLIQHKTSKSLFKPYLLYNFFKYISKILNVMIERKIFFFFFLGYQYFYFNVLYIFRVNYNI